MQIPEYLNRGWNTLRIAKAFSVSPYEIDTKWSLCQWWDAMIYLDILEDAELLAQKYYETQRKMKAGK